MEIEFFAPEYAIVVNKIIAVGKGIWIDEKQDWKAVIILESGKHIYTDELFEDVVKRLKDLP